MKYSKGAKREAFFPTRVTFGRTPSKLRFFCHQYVYKIHALGPLYPVNFVKELLALKTKMKTRTRKSLLMAGIAIMALLDEIENQKFKIPWIEQVRSAVRYSNEDQFENLLKMIK